MSENYWLDRGNNLYEYKGEKYYTITPIPYYLKRRELLLKNVENIINKLVEKKRFLKICDYGCGDGYYA
jgi:hypothetical protein